jgi:hypothetical protein
MLNIRYIIIKQTLNSSNKLNVALGSTNFILYNAQHEKKIGFFYYTCTMIKNANIFLTQQFERKKCDVVVIIFPSTQRSKVWSFSQSFFDDKWNEWKKLHRTFK